MLNGRPTPLYAALFEEWFRVSVPNGEGVDPLQKANMKDVFVSGFISSFNLLTDVIAKEEDMPRTVAETLIAMELEEYSEARKAGRSDI